MSRIARHIARGLRVLMRQMPAATFVYRGTAYPCLINTTGRGDALELGGWASAATLTIFVLRSDIPDVVTLDSTVITLDSNQITMDASGGMVPFPGKRLTQGTRDWRIDRVRDDGSGVYWALDLVDPTTK